MLLDEPFEIAADDVEDGGGDPELARRSRDHPALATFVGRTRLNGRGSTKETWHLDFDLSAAGLDYTVGDAFGLMGDSKASLLNRVSDIPERNALYATRVVDVRVKLLPLTDQVDRVALDKYTFTRDAYLQKRLNDVYDGDPPEAKDVPDGGDAQTPKP